MTACTEKEAAEKWCPHYRMEHSAGNGGCVCIGSRCMQWRWLSGTSEIASSPKRPPGDGWEDHGELSYLPAGYHGWYRNIPDDRRRGYCGLAGKP